jgi:hypothetical protein
MPKNFDQMTAFAAKNIKIAGMRIALQPLLDLQRQAVQYPSGEGRLSPVGLIWRDCAVVQTLVFAPVQETVRWQVSRYWSVLSDVAGGASSKSRRL